MSEGLKVQRPIRIVIADDQQMVREALAVLLGLNPDIEVVGTYGSGGGVYRGIAELDGGVDVALLDIEMPDGNGIETCEKIRNSFPNTQVIMVTTFGRPGYLTRAMDAGARGFVVKDAPAEQLAKAVRNVHAGGVVVDSELAAKSLIVGDNPLNEREIEVLVAAAGGATVAQMAAELYRAEGTVRNQLSSAIGKTGASNRAEAVAIAVEYGWITI